MLTQCKMWPSSLASEFCSESFPVAWSDAKIVTFICCKAKVTFRVTKLGRYVIVDVGDNCVTFRARNVRIKI